MVVAQISILLVFSVQIVSAKVVPVCIQKMGGIVLRTRSHEAENTTT